MAAISKNIYIGSLEDPDFSFDNNTIITPQINTSVTFIGDELEYDTMFVELYCDENTSDFFNLPYGTPLWYYENGDLAGKFYTTVVKHIAGTKFSVEATSAIGLIDKEKFYGCYYDDAPFSDIVKRIIGSNGLQAFQGYYKKAYIGFTGSGQIEGKATGGVLNSWKYTGSATMRSRMQAKFTLYEFLGDSYSWGVNIKDAYLPLLGSVNINSRTSSSINQYQYGIFMHVTRASTSDSWPRFGEVFFAYGLNEISLGTPSDTTTYIVDINPDAGVAVINGVSYQITANQSEVLIGLHVYGGGSALAGISNNTTLIFSGNIHCCKCIYEYYRVYSYEGVLQVDPCIVKNEYYPGFHFFDFANDRISRTMERASVDESDFMEYTGENPIFHKHTVFEQDFIDSMNFSDDIADIPINGWIDICTKRDALHQLLIATGVILIKADDGSPLFTSASVTETGSISSDNTYLGGTIEKLERTNVVKITEHSYYFTSDTSKREVVFDGTDVSPSKYYIVEFSKRPARLTIASDLNLIDYNENAAVVSGAGSISSAPCTHMTRVIQRIIGDSIDGREVSVNNATLITTFNSEFLMDRLVSFYGSAYKVFISFVHNFEKCGRKYSFSDPLGNLSSGYLAKATLYSSGSTTKVDGEFLTNYTPPPAGEEFSNFIILTGSGTWEVPEEIFEKTIPKIRVVLIGGGTGGGSGYAGQDGFNTPIPWQGTDAPEGGDAGEAGAGGKIFSFTIVNPAASYDYSCGAGGIGGAISNSHSVSNPGSEGGPTTFSDGFNTYSSGSGTRNEDGIINIFTGEFYAIKFSIWSAKGGNGGYGSIEEGGLRGNYGRNSWMLKNNVISQYNGSYLIGYRGENGNGLYNGIYILTAGGYGGGGAIGGTAGDGGDARKSGNEYYAGNGGNGADAEFTPLPPTDLNPNYYGYGGTGGCGGGAGGCSGTTTTQVSGHQGTGGRGGDGGNGGDGAPGCVIIYY